MAPAIRTVEGKAVERLSRGIFANSMHDDRSWFCRRNGDKLDGDWQRSPTEKGQNRENVPAGPTRPQPGSSVCPFVKHDIQRKQAGSDNGWGCI